MLFRSIITCYRGDVRDFHPQDDPAVIKLLTTLWQEADMKQLATQVLAAEQIWGEDLNHIPHLTERLTHFLDAIASEGMTQTLKTLLQA